MDAQSYLFVLGRTPALALLELKTLFPQISNHSEEIAILSEVSQFSTEEVMNVLGGTTKIAVIVGKTAQLTPEEFIQFFPDSMKPIDFGFSFYNMPGVPRSFMPSIKSQLEKRGIRARYIEARHGITLSTVSVDKSHMSEFIVVKDTDGYIVGKTIEVQSYEEWNKRDYDRPYSDPKSGMLPPKVARMIANIARNTPYAEWKSKQKTILDPFCGMGTILAEAYMTGWRVIGGDSSPDAVEKAQKNLSWLIANNADAQGGGGHIFVSDATHVSEKVLPDLVDAVVTEPFMGSTGIVNRPTVDPEKVKNIIKGLEKLYIGCLREWYKILAPKGIIIIALPSYTVSGRSYVVKKVVDMCESLGYTIVVGPIEYSRPQATVKREFYVLQKIK